VNPTYDGLLAIWDAFNNTSSGTNSSGVPSGWLSSDYGYWSATPSSTGHALVVLSYGNVRDNVDDGSNYVALQVL
jgi:hypothetical protein